MFTLKFFSKLLKILSSAATPNQIAGGFVLGMILGLTPVFTLHNLLVLLLIILLNVNIAVAIFGFALFSGITYLLDPLFHSLGYYLLVDVPGLRSLWTTMYNTPILALGRYNNTVVMGSLVGAVILIIPVFFLTRYSVQYYRRALHARFQRFKIVQAARSTKIYDWYKKVKAFGG